jgi:DNA polymerase V
MPSKGFRFGISSDAQGVDLNQLLVAHPVSTFFMRLAEDIVELELRAGDIVVVDRSLRPKQNDIVVVSIADAPELQIMRFRRIHSEAQLWGTVQHLIRKLKV